MTVGPVQCSLNTQQPYARLDVQGGAGGQHASPQYYMVGTVQAAHDRIIWAADWSPSGSFFATGSRDRVLKVWRFDPACPTMPTTAAAVLGGRRAAVTALAFMPLLPPAAADILAIGYEDGSLELLSVHSVDELEGPSVATSQVCWFLRVPRLAVQHCIPDACFLILGCMLCLLLSSQQEPPLESTSESTCCSNFLVCA